MENSPPRSDDSQPRVVEPEAIGGELTDLTCTLRFGAKALFSDGDNILLIKEQRADGSTFWTLPGGGVKPREPLTDGLHRELKEELCCLARLADEVGRCRYRHTTSPNVVTHYTVFSGTLLTRPDTNPEEGILNYAWVDPGDLPGGTLNPFRQVVQKYADCDSQTAHSRISNRSASQELPKTESQ